MSPLARAWNSLHARLLIGAAVWTVAALALSDVAISTLFRQHVTGQFQHELVDHLAELQALVSTGPEGRLRLSRPVSDPRFSATGSGFYWEVDEVAGGRLASPSLGAERLPMTAGFPPIEPHTGGLSPSGRPILILERQSADARLHFAVAIEPAEMEPALAQFSRLLRTSLTLLAAGLLAAAAAQVVFGLRPIGRLRRTLAEVRGGDTERLPDDFPSEVRPLVNDLNGLIASNREMIRRARAQAGNLAHGLKGPLAVLTDEADRLDRSGDPAAADLVRRQCEAMSRQISYHLARARAAAARGSAVRARPSETVGAVMSALARLHADRGLALENDLSPRIEVACAPEDLSEMIGNLVDNAAKWATGRVRVSDAPGPRDGRVCIVVDDDGPGIAPESRASVFGIGERLDEQKPGAGLGLAIVKDLVELYGGSIRLDESPLGGLRATLELDRFEAAERA